MLKSMSAHRLSIPHLIRNGHRYATFSQTPVQAQNDPHNDEQQVELGRLTEAVLPYINLVPHRSDAHLFSANFSIPTWPSAYGISDCDFDGLNHGFFQRLRHNGIQFTLPQKKTTNEVSVQTDLSGEENESTKRFETIQLEFENQIGIELMNKGLSGDAVKHFLHASENGCVEAMFNLADCLFNGTGAKENKREAWRLWGEAAELGHVPAMYNLAACHIGGDGTPVNEKKGLEWMWKAANFGNADASFYLILKLIHEGKQESVRHLVKYALRDSDYDTEFHSWIRDKVIDEHSLKMIQEEMGLE